MAHVLGQQPSLFDRSRLVERRLSSGAIVRLRLEPLPAGRVKVVEYRRRGHEDARWQRRPGEEGRVCPFAALGLDLPFEDVFA